MVCREVTVVLVCLLVGVVWRFSEYALVIFACTYAAAGVVLHIVRFFRHRLVSRTV